MRAILLLAGVSLFVAACVTVAPVARDPLPGYTMVWRENFIRGCMASGRTPRPVCECGIYNIEREVQFEDSRALDRAAAAGRDPSPATVAQYRDIMERCSAERAV